MVEVEEKYMARCIELAKGGRGNVSPNPMVGAVVVGSKVYIKCVHCREYNAESDTE